MDFSFIQSGEFSSTLCALFWAIAVILFRQSGQHIPPVALNLFKGVLGFSLFLLTMLAFGIEFFPKHNTTADWLILLISGALGIGIADSLFFASLNRLGAGRQAIVSCLYSPLVISCSFIYLDEPIGFSLLIAVGLLIAAIVIGTWQSERSSQPIPRRQLMIGIIFGCLSTLLMAIGIVLAKPVLDRSGVWWATTVRMSGGVLLLAIQGLLPSNRRDTIEVFTPNKSWKVALPGAFIGTYLALIFWIMGMKYTHTTIASVLNQLSTIFILVLATIFLREKLTLRKTIAICMGFIGGVVATW